MTTLAEFMILSGADNRPLMLDKDLYDSWKSIMELYMQNIEHGRMILESVERGPLIWPTIKENYVTRTTKYEELSATEKIQVDCDLKATNIILQGLPSDVYSLVNHHRVAKDLWEIIQLLMQGTSLTKHERECKLYDAFDKFAHIKEESLYQYYLRFTQLINDMNIYKMKIEQFQLNAYLEQHELHANEVRIMREGSQDPLALVANHQMIPSHFNTYQSSYNNPQFQQQFSPSQSPQYGSIHPIQHYSTTYPYTPSAITYPSASYPNAYSSTVHQDAYFGLAVHVFKHGDDPVDAINKTMSFLSTVITYRFLTTNNQLRNSSNPRQQITIHDGRVTVQSVQGRQSSFAFGTSGTRANISGTGGNNSGQQRVVKCFNYQWEGHMARQCPNPKRKKDATWFWDKVLLVEAQGYGKVLNEEEFAFLADPRVAEGPVTQTIITHNAAYQADNLDAYDSDCDDFSTVKAVLMSKLSSYGSDVLSEVPHSENTHNDMLNQSVQKMPYSKQTHLVNYPENEITSDNNIIPYSQYLL
ncbi:retrovirus-related pol polyprotein from transposon TNT 1-94, partial [Tanacetum coccineum]